MAEGALRVEGLDELVRAFRVANREVAKDVRQAIELAGEPIRQLGSELIRTEVSGMSRTKMPWWRLRLGVERNTIGYVVPETRGARDWRSPRKRRNLAKLIAEREERALAAHAHRVEREFVAALNDVAKAWSRVG